MFKIFLILVLSAIFLVACDSAPNTSRHVSDAEKNLDSAQPPVSNIPEVKAVVDVEPLNPEPATTASKPEQGEVSKEAVVKANMSGEQVYNQSCQNCHATGAAGSPKLGDVASWKQRIDKGIDALYQSAIKGMPSTAMMPKGTCNKCNDDELKAAVDFMVSKVK